jgi:hypothetical protein
MLSSCCVIEALRSTVRPEAADDHRIPAFAVVAARFKGRIVGRAGVEANRVRSQTVVPKVGQHEPAGFVGGILERELHVEVVGWGFTRNPGDEADLAIRLGWLVCGFPDLDRQNHQHEDKTPDGSSRHCNDPIEVTSHRFDDFILPEEPPAHTDHFGLLPGVLQVIEFGFRSTPIARITRPIYSGSRFRSHLQRLVHLVKATLNIAIHHLPENR